jgi:hypothetical protein
MPLAELVACAGATHMSNHLRDRKLRLMAIDPSCWYCGTTPACPRPGPSVFLTFAAISGREHALSRRLAQLATRPLHERCLVRNLPAGRVDAEVPEQS